MAYWKRTGHVFATVIVLVAGLALGEVRDAEARGGRGRHPVFVGGSTVPTSDLGLAPGVRSGRGAGPGPAVCQSSASTPWQWQR
jgi:hypothetical protein